MPEPIEEEGFENPVLEYPHDWVALSLESGDSICARCRMTNREAAAAGKLHECEEIPA